MNLSIRHKLIVGFSLVLGIILLISSFNFYRIWDISEIQYKILHHSQPAVIAGEELNEGVHLSLAALSGNHIFHTDVEISKLFAKEKKEGFELIHHALDKLHQLSTSWNNQKNIQLLKNIDSNISDFKTTYERAEALLSQVEKSSSSKGETSLYEAYFQADKIKQNFTKLKHSLDEQVEADSELLNLETSQVLFMLVIGTILAMIVSVLISLLISRSIIKPLDIVVKRAKLIAEGDLSLDVLETKDEDKSELGELVKAINLITTNLHRVVSNVTETSKELSLNMTQVCKLARTAIETMRNQQSATNQAATAMEEMNVTVNDVAKNAAKASSSANSANDSAANGESIVQSTAEKISNLAESITASSNIINKLGEDTDGVDVIVDTISGIAEQTNLLALNAAIEAARAGEQGRGFAVVADEVRTLAARTQESTSEIRMVLDKLKSSSESAVEGMQVGFEQVNHTVEMADNAKYSLSEIVEYIRNINDMNIQIATASEEQSMVTKEITANINDISNESNNILNNAEQTNSMIEKCNDKAYELGKLVSQFKV